MAVSLVSLIAAVADDGIIGRDGGLPWRQADDLRRFKRLTMGHHLVLGRRTYEMLDSTLPGRTLVVLSRSLVGPPAPGISLARSLPEALAIAAGDDEVFIGGGGAVYREALPLASRLYLTRVHGDVIGDTVFPPVDRSQWRLISGEDHGAGDGDQYPYSFLVLERR